MHLNMDALQKSRMKWHVFNIVLIFLSLFLFRTKVKVTHCCNISRLLHYSYEVV